MNKRFLLAVMALTSTLGGTAFAQSSDIRQAEQDREAQRQRELQDRPQYLPGDRRRIERERADYDARQRAEADARQRAEAAARQRGDYAGRQRADYEARQRADYEARQRADYAARQRAEYDRRSGRGEYRDYRAEEWRHGGRGAGPYRNWNRGGYLPREYRSRNYVVDDWRSHRLYAPPRGYHWVQAGGDYVLVAIATGLIAAVLLNQ